MSELGALGLTVTSDGLVKGTTALEKFSGASVKAGAASDTLSADLRKLDAVAGGTDVALRGVANAAGMAASGSGGFANSMRGVSQQLSQVGQQTMATGNFVQALAIQLPDLGLAFGAVGAVAGLLAGIALPLVINLLGGAGDAAKTASDAVSDLDAVVGSYAEAVEAAGLPTEALIEKYGRLAPAAREALSAVADVALVDAIMQTDATIQAVSDSLTKVSTFSGFRVMRDEFDLTDQSARSLVSRLLELERASGLEAQAIAAGRVNELLISTYGTVEAMPGPLQQAYGQMARIALAASDVNQQSENAQQSINPIPGLLANAAAYAGQAASAVGGIAGAANSAYGAVSSLVGKMYDLANARAIAERSSTGYAAELARTGQSSGPDSVRTREQFGGGAFAAPVLGAGLVAPASVGGGGGGGGGGAARVDEYTEAQKRALAVIADVNESAVTQDQVIGALQTMHDTGAISADQLATAIANVKEEMADVGKVSFSLSESLSGVFTDALTGAKKLQDGLKDLLGSMSELFLNQAFKMFLPTLLPGIDFGGFRAAGGPVSSGTSYIVGERGPELFTPGRSGSITPNHALGGGGTTVQINNYSGAPVQERRSRGPDGREIVKVIIGEELGSGGYDKQMGRYGANPARVRR